jgi:putative hydrolase of the HAD superfamily
MKIHHLLLGFLSMFLFSSFTNPLPPTKKNIRAIVFDFGGVIGKANRDTVQKGVSDAFHISQEKVAPLLAELKQYFLKGGDERFFWEQYAASLGKKLPENWLTEFRFIIASAIQEIPGSLDIVRHLHQLGYKVALISNVRKDKADVLKKLGYYDYFNPTLLSCDVGYTKPDPKIYDLLLKKLHLSPEECLLIDNKMDNVLAAQNMGFDSICFTSSEQLLMELKKRGLLLNP